MRNHFLRAVPKISNDFSLNYLTSGGDIADLTTYNFTSVDFGTANSTREIFVFVQYSSTVARTISSATIGGVSATIINIGSGATSGNGVIFATVPTGVSGTVSVTLSGGAIRCLYTVYRVANRVDIGGSSTDTSVLAGLSFSSPAQVSSIVIPAGGFAIGSYGVNTDITGNSPANSPMTLDVINTTVASESLWQYGISTVNTSSSSNTIANFLSWTGGGTIGARAGTASFNG